MGVRDQVQSIMPSIMKMIEPLRNMFPNSPIRIRFRFRPTESEPNVPEPSRQDILTQNAESDETPFLPQVPASEQETPECFEEAQSDEVLSLLRRLRIPPSEQETDEFFEEEQSQNTESDEVLSLFRRLRIPPSEQTPESFEEQQSQNTESDEVPSLPRVPASEQETPDCSSEDEPCPGCELCAPSETKQVEQEEPSEQSSPEQPCSASSEDEPCPGCELCTPADTQQTEQDNVASPERSEGFNDDAPAKTEEPHTDSLDNLLDSMERKAVILEKQVNAALSHEFEGHEHTEDRHHEQSEELTIFDLKQHDTYLPVVPPVLESAEFDSAPMMPMKEVTVAKQLTTETCFGMEVREVFLDDVPIVLAILLPLFALGYFFGKWLVKRRRANMIVVGIPSTSPRYSANPSRTSILPMYNDQVTTLAETDVAIVGEEAV